SFLKWIAGGGGDVREPISKLLDSGSPAITPDLPVSEAVLAMGQADSDVLTITADGTKNGRVHAIVTPRDLAPVFGDQPVDILREISRATDTDVLRDLNQRARSLVLRYLNSAASFDWLSGFTCLVDAKILGRLIAMTVPEAIAACWCFCGSSG